MALIDFLFYFIYKNNLLLTLTLVFYVAEILVQSGTREARARKAREGI